jgi:GxxExxY protein
MDIRGYSRGESWIMEGTVRADLELLHGALTGQIIGAFFDVYNELGHGFAELVYQRAVVVALAERGVPTETERILTIRYHGAVVGEYRADLIVDNKVVVECKVAAKVLQTHETQLLNYLKATGIKIGLILNFCSEATFRRMLLSSTGKGSAVLRA